jgi:hypothetical protein
MGTVSTTGGMTLIEEAIRTHNDKLLPIINTIAKTNKVFLYAQWAQCNGGTVEHGSRTATIPTGTWCDYDEGASTGTATTQPYEEPTAMLDHMFIIDQRRKSHMVDPERNISNEIELEMQGLMQQAMTAFFYGDRSGDTNYAGKMINGITNRTDYNTLSSEYVYDNAGGNASATQNKTSIYIMNFGHDQFELIYPRGDEMGKESIATPDAEGLGIKIQKLKSDTATDSNGNEYPADKLWFQMHWGICPRDPGAIRRISNISTTNIDNVDDFSFNEDYFIDAVTDMRNTDGAIACCNRTVMAQIWKRVKDSSAYNFTQMEDAFGNPVPAVCGIPVILSEAIVSNEATVS